jgi:hypothetical protein
VPALAIVAVQFDDDSTKPVDTLNNAIGTLVNAAPPNETLTLSLPFGEA